MPRTVTFALSAKKIDAIKEPGRYADGNGLYLVAKASERHGVTKAWQLRYTLGGTRKVMGLGAYPDVSIKDAREKTAAAHEKVDAGIDPVVARAAARTVIDAAREAMPTFEEWSNEMIDLWAPSFKNPKHVAQWRSTIKTYCNTILKLPVNAVTSEHIISILQPIWLSKTETARRLQGRLKRLLDAAKVKGLRAGENPAMWEGHLKLLLPKPKKLKRGHHKAVPYAEIPTFMYELLTIEKVIRNGGTGRGKATVIRVVSRSQSLLALEFTILTASRTSEVLKAQIKEVDFVKRVWIVPEIRTKTGREHRVPLTRRAMAIIKEATIGVNDPDAFIFRGATGSNLSNMSMAMTLRGLDEEATVHGFRSSFRDWVGEETEYAREIAEAALGHLVGDEAEQAYRRGDALERRRKMMQDWETYVYSDKRVSLTADA